MGSVTVTVVPVPRVDSTATLPANMLRTTLCTTTSPMPLPSPNAFVVKPGSKIRSRSWGRMPAPSSRIPLQVLGTNARPLIPHAQPDGVPHRRQADADRCRPAGARVGGVADQVDQQIVECVGVAFQVHDLEGGVELEGNLLLLEDAALERAAGADHAHGVEPLGPRQRATRAVLDGPQEARRAVDILHHLAELVEQL